MKKNFVFLAALGFLVLYACNSGTQSGQSSTTDTTSSSDTSTAVAAPAAFTPFDVVRVQFHVKDYAKWYAEFLSKDSARLANGIHKYALDRGLDADSNMVIVVSKIDDVQKAKAFYASKDLKDAMMKAGVTGAPKISYMHVIRNDTSAVTQDQRVYVVHHVKNFDNWVKVYDGEGKDARAANGMVDRSMARSLDDSNTVSLLFVVTDMAKAKARSNSPELKKLMDSAGVDSKPDVTMFRLVEKF